MRRIISSSVVIGVYFAIVVSGSISAWAQDYYSVGEKFLEQKQYRLAAEQFAKAIEQQPGDIESWRLLGYSYRRLGILDSAVVAYNEILQISPDDYDAHLALGNLYSWIPQYDSAEIMYGYILGNDSTDTAALLGLGRINAWQGRYQRAVEFYRKAINHEPDNIWAFHGMAWAYAWSNDLKNARINFEIALMKDSTFAEAFEGLARLNLWTDRPFAATKFINRAMDLDPGNPQYQTLKSELQNSIDFRLDNTYTYWQEDDWGRITKNHQLDESISRRLSDRWHWALTLAVHRSSRDSTSLERRIISTSARYRCADKLLLSGSIGTETINNELDRTSLRIDISSIRPLRALSVELRQGIYEPWSKTTSTAYLIDLSSYSYGGISLSAAGGYWDMSDDNWRIIGTVNIKLKVVSKPSVNIGYRYRYWDYDFRSPNYYSPLDLDQHELGIDFRHQLKKWVSVEGDGYYSLNSDQVKAKSGSVTFELNAIERLAGILSFSAYQNNFDYSMFNITGRLRIRL